MKASLWGALITAALNHLLSKGLCRLSALQTGWKGEKREFGKVKWSATGLTRGQGEKQKRKSSILLAGLAPQPNSAPALPSSKSGHTANTHKKITYPEWSALSQIKVPLSHKLSIFNRTILIPLLSHCASPQHTGITQGDWYVTKYTNSVFASVVLIAYGKIPAKVSSHQSGKLLCCGEWLSWDMVQKATGDEGPWWHFSSLNQHCLRGDTDW